MGINGRWQALDFARLSHSTVSFFNEPKPETAASRWNRVSLNASKVPQLLPEKTEKSLVSSSLLRQKTNRISPLCCSCCLLATGGSGFIQRRQGPQASFPALDRGREYKSYKSHWSTVCQFLVVFALDLVRCFHVSEKRLLSVSVDL